jgi:hypothetical protein
MDIRFKGIESSTALSLAAAEKARDKAEEAQKAKNETTNEFRGQLSDQAATLMPRKESESAMNALRKEDKLARESIALNLSNQVNGEKLRLDGLVKEWTIWRDAVNTQLTTLNTRSITWTAAIGALFLIVNLVARFFGK